MRRDGQGHAVLHVDAVQEGVPVLGVQEPTILARPT
jgi:hypothetical protein